MLDRRPSPIHLLTLLVLPLGLLGAVPATARTAASRHGGAPPVTDAGATSEVWAPSLFAGLEWRNVGPLRGGRATAVAGVADEPFTYYMGSTGGGVWRTSDAGGSWENLSGRQLHTGSVGAIAVAPSDPNVIWVGMGEACIRGVMTTHGDGVYRSVDRGRTWQHLGLEESRHISAVVVHPTAPDTAWVAAQGHAWAPNPERGVYKTTDGGATWRRVLFVDESTGASDLVLDATNPRILYAALWQHRRYPWKIESGGPGSGLWKSVDGGETWKRLDKGLPEVMGKIGVAVSPAAPDRVWAIVEAEKGGLYCSDDGGASWKLINGDRKLQTRSWYYMHVFADPRNADLVWVLNAPAMKSIDGGKSFQRVSTPHGDNHDLWINPRDPRFLVNANDGGATVSLNGGQSWSSEDNQPTAQFYRVAVDNQYPFRIYGGQQDNSAVVIQSRSDEETIGERHWESISGCESAYPAFDPDHPRFVYGGCYQGIVEEWDAVSKRTRDVMAFPSLNLAVDPKLTRYRFNWNAPLLVSRHDPRRLYHAANLVLMSEDRGVTWREVSPDLTRDEKDRQGPGGGPITNEGAGGEVYGTLIALVESPHEAGVLWAGSDDGRLHLTRDGGAMWREVTLPGVGEAMINAIEVSPHDPATVYVAATRYKSDDLTPLIFASRDYGASWSSLASGLPRDLVVRVVREDPERAGLLYAGTERGLAVSWDGGQRWQEMDLGLPVVPITDLVVHDGALVASTQGRAFWVLDDLAPLRGMDAAVAAAELHLFPPVAAVLDAAGSSGPPGTAGVNPPAGAVLRYLIGGTPQVDAAENTPLVIEIFDSAGRLVRRAASDDEAVGEEGAPGPRSEPPATGAGLNRWVWDLTYQPPERVEGLVVFGPRTPTVGPGSYRVRLTRGAAVTEGEVEVRIDPRTGLTAADYAPRQELLVALRERLHELYDTANRVADARGQIEALVARVEKLPGGDEVRDAGKALVERLEAVDGKLVQRRHTNFQDIINAPPSLNGELAFLLAAVNSGPPLNAGARERFAELEGRFGAAQGEADRLLGEELATFLALYTEHGFEPVVVKDPEPSMPVTGTGSGGG